MPCRAYISTLDFKKEKQYLTVLDSQVLTITPLLLWRFCSAALSQKIEKNAGTDFEFIV